VKPGLLDFIKLGLQPILALRLSLLRVNMWRFIAFIGKEKEPPAQNLKYRGHAANAPLNDFSFLQVAIVKAKTGVGSILPKRFQPEQPGSDNLSEPRFGIPFFAGRIYTKLRTRSMQFTVNCLQKNP
jgi:hypothetical protein